MSSLSAGAMEGEAKVAEYLPHAKATGSHITLELNIIMGLRAWRPWEASVQAQESRGVECGVMRQTMQLVVVKILEKQATVRQRPAWLAACAKRAVGA